jgi:TRAP-type C4-dicarboxylate transport system permease large subunit
VQSLRTSGSMNAVMKGSLPFVLMLLLMVLFLALLPGLALWLPSVFGG